MVSHIRGNIFENSVQSLYRNINRSHGLCAQDMPLRQGMYRTRNGFCYWTLVYLNYKPSHSIYYSKNILELHLTYLALDSDLEKFNLQQVWGRLAIIPSICRQNDSAQNTFLYYSFIFPACANIYASTNLRWFLWYEWLAWFIFRWPVQIFMLQWIWGDSCDLVAAQKPRECHFNKLHVWIETCSIVSLGENVNLVSVELQ